MDSLPGVPGGTSFLGTFDREEALEDERLDFFASGHPLVEGILAHLEESRLGRVAVLRVAIGSETGRGLLGALQGRAVVRGSGGRRSRAAAARVGCSCSGSGPCARGA